LRNKKVKLLILKVLDRFMSQRIRLSLMLAKMKVKDKQVRIGRKAVMFTDRNHLR